MEMNDSDVGERIKEKVGRKELLLSIFSFLLLHRLRRSASVGGLG